MSGWRPPDEWRPYTANPAWEVFGREVDGVFRYRLRRRAAKAVVPQLPAVGIVGDPMLPPRPSGAVEPQPAPPTGKEAK